jgi:hypothetical protein
MASLLSEITTFFFFFLYGDIIVVPIIGNTDLLFSLFMEPEMCLIIFLKSGSRIKYQLIYYNRIFQFFRGALT